jgi:hypothetical protein
VIASPSSRRQAPSARSVRFYVANGLLAQARGRIVGDPLVLLLEHDIELGLHVVLGELEGAEVVHVRAGHGRRVAAEDQAFYQGKRQTARYYLRWELPAVHQQAELLQSLDDTTLEMQEAWF